MREKSPGHRRVAQAVTACCLAVALAGCQGATPLTWPPSAPATAGLSASSAPGVSARYVEGSDHLWDARLYEINTGRDWTETSPFALSAGLYHVTGQCAGEQGKSLALTVLLQQVRETDGAIAQEYRWECGPVETVFIYGELRRMAGGMYRLVVKDATTGGTFQIEPASPDEFVRDLAASSPPQAPAKPEAVAAVVPCPAGIDPGPDESPFGPCVTFRLSWTDNAPPVTYRVYESWRMPGTPLSPCNPDATLSIDTGGAVTRALTGIYPPAYAQGTCFWVAAANSAGESARVPVQIIFD